MRLPRLCCCLILIGIFGVTVAWPTPARAASFNVAAGDVAGLIAAINAANTNGEPSNTINLAHDSTYLIAGVDTSPNAISGKLLGSGGALGPNGLPVITSALKMNYPAASGEVSNPISQTGVVVGGEVVHIRFHGPGF